MSSLSLAVIGSFSSFFSCQVSLFCILAPETCCLSLPYFGKIVFVSLKFYYSLISLIRLLTCSILSLASSLMKFWSLSYLGWDEIWSERRVQTFVILPWLFKESSKPKSGYWYSLRVGLNFYISSKASLWALVVNQLILCCFAFCLN